MSEERKVIEKTEDIAEHILWDLLHCATTYVLSGSSSSIFMSMQGRKMHKNPLLLRTFLKRLENKQKKLYSILN